MWRCWQRPESGWGEALVSVNTLIIYYSWNSPTSVSPGHCFAFRGKKYFHLSLQVLHNFQGLPDWCFRWLRTRNDLKTLQKAVQTKVVMTVTPKATLPCDQGTEEQTKDIRRQMLNIYHKMKEFLILWLMGARGTDATCWDDRAENVSTKVLCKQRTPSPCGRGQRVQDVSPSTPPTIDTWIWDLYLQCSLWLGNCLHSCEEQFCMGILSENLQVKKTGTQTCSVSKTYLNKHDMGFRTGSHRGKQVGCETLSAWKFTIFGKGRPTGCGAGRGGRGDLNLVERDTTFKHQTEECIHVSCRGS